MRKNYKLSIIIPMYKEPKEVVKPLLDSIALQQNVNLKNDVEVVIVNDGCKEFILDEQFINSYPFDIHFYLKEHSGVSATRNYGLDKSNGKYIMFCDCDDMFYNMCGLWILFREMDMGEFDTLVSAFIEETRDMSTQTPIYINRDMDSTFVHGKVHRRQYLIDNKIRWNPNLTIHEDSYFNCLCQKLANPERAKYCATPFYLWKWRDDSVCRHDPDYILKTYTNMLDSSDALIGEFLKRKKPQEAQFYSVAMIYDAYFSMNCEKWLDINNQGYRDTVEKRFKAYWDKYKMLYSVIPDEAKKQILMGIKNRFFQEGMFLEKITFDDWIEHIETEVK